MKITILGCGTSTGVPAIGCRCPVCRSDNPRNRRTRASIYIESGDKGILVDTATDLYFQAITHNLNRVNAVIFTHTHADHIHGIDELRNFNFIQREIIPIYGSEETMSFISRTFAYIFTPTQIGGGKPLLDLNPVEDEFELFDLRVLPLELMHGSLPIFGYRFIKPGTPEKRFAYLTDCSEIPDDSLKELHGLDLLILDALREDYHPTHLTIKDAVSVANGLQPRRTVLTHFNHSVDYESLANALPPGIEPAYDGLLIEL